MFDTSKRRLTVILISLVLQQATSYPISLANWLLNRTISEILKSRV